MHRCPICCRWYFSHIPHICAPRWLARLKNDNAEDAQTIFAPDARDAAADYVERLDDSFASFTESETVLITPDPDEDDIDWNTLPWQTYLVTGELIHTYNARLQTQEAPHAG